MKFTKLMAFVVLALGVSVSAQADFLAYDVPNGTVGRATASASMGLDFTVNNAISVTSLGFFDSSQNGLVAGHNVTIYNADTQTAVDGLTVTIPSGTSAVLINGNRFVSITPIALSAGHYSIVTSALAGGDPIYIPGSNRPASIEDSSGLVTFTGSGRTSIVANVFPTTIFTSTVSNPFAAATFTFTAVPEPGSIALFGLGAVALLIARARAARRKTS